MQSDLRTQSVMITGEVILSDTMRNYSSTNLVRAGSYQVEEKEIDGVPFLCLHLDVGSDYADLPIQWGAPKRDWKAAGADIE